MSSSAISVERHRGHRRRRANLPSYSVTARPASREAFTTYGNYLRAWKTTFQILGVAPVAFGPSPAMPVGLATGRSNEIATCLHRYWGNLRALEILNTSGIAAEVLTVHPPIAYYAAHNASRAYLFSKNIVASTAHRKVLNQMAQECRATHLPAPWSAYCEEAPTSRLVRGLGQIAWPASNLENVNQGNAVGFAALSLSTTRKDEVTEKVAESRGSRRMARPGTRAKLEQSLDVTTIFGFFYRFRLEAHYGKADNFAAFQTDAEANRFGADLFEVVDATTWMLEETIHQRVGTAQMRLWYVDYMTQHQIASGEGPVGRRYESLP